MAAAELVPILILLAAAVLAVVVCRFYALPPILGYLVAGLVLGPHALGLVANNAQTHALAEVGVVFLMFSIGLEFSLSKLRVMRREVFGLGGAQVVIMIAACVAAALALGASWQAGLALGGAAAMSSTAVVSKLLSERLELDTAHGRSIIGVLLFQDLAVVPLLILVPVLGQSGGAIGMAIGVALAKAAFVLAVVLLAGPRVMRAWFGVVARRKSTELFVLNVLLVILAMAFLTGLAGLSLPLGAFLAGMLLSETEYRYQVDEEIKPFRDVLLGLFFITVGMMLDLRLVGGTIALVLALLVLLVGLKLALIGVLSRAFGAAPGTALRTGLALAQGGEFGFVLLAQADLSGVLSGGMGQALMAAMIFSMMTTPFLIRASDRIVLRFATSEWLLRSLEMHRVAVRSLETEGHVIILGYGRNGQHVARLLDAEGVRYVALDLDPERVREAALAGDTVVFADSSRREALIAAGIMRAAAVVVTFADSAAAVRLLAHIQALNPTVPVIARARGRGHRPTGGGGRLRDRPRGPRIRPHARLAHARLGGGAAQPSGAAHALGARPAIRFIARAFPRRDRPARRTGRGPAAPARGDARPKRPRDRKIARRPGAQGARRPGERRASHRFGAPPRPRGSRGSRGGRRGRPARCARPALERGIAPLARLETKRPARAGLFSRIGSPYSERQSA